MNLAIHDANALIRLHTEGVTNAWGEQGIIPWAPSSLIRCRGCLGPLKTAGVLRDLDLHEDQARSFDVFRHRLRYRLTFSEQCLLFLACETRSVLLAGERAVVEFAHDFGLRVCSGLPDELAAIFIATQLEKIHDIGTPDAPPGISSRRRVPDRDEPVCPSASLRPRRSKDARDVAVQTSTTTA